MTAHVAAYYAYRAAVCEAHGLIEAAKHYAVLAAKAAA